MDLTAAARSVLIEEPSLAKQADLLQQPFNDYGNGQRLISLFGQSLRYCHAMHSWLGFFDDTHWEIDRKDATRKLAQETMLEFARQAMNGGNEGAAKYAGSCLNSQRLTAAMREAEPHLAVSVDELDTDPFALNFSNGTVDLRTGIIRAHRREDLITKWIPRRYRPATECRTWRRVVSRVLPGLEDFFQCAVGYSATGITSEKAVFIPHGGGNNGKTMLLATVREVLGDYYAVLLQIDTLMARNVDNNSQADLADLRGARFVMTSETEEGQRLAEGKLKRLTQGMGRIKAVRKYENPIEFSESHKLWLDCNHKPVVRGTDPAIWNRLRLIPFGVTIPDEEIDRELPRKLIAESEGILAWIVEGAVQWHEYGLGKPLAMESAGREWRSEMDQLGRFIEEQCIVGDHFRASSSSLYGEYKRWAEANGEQFVTSTALSLRLKERTFEKKHTDRGTVYLGIAIRAES